MYGQKIIKRHIKSNQTQVIIQQQYPFLDKPCIYLAARYSYSVRSRRCTDRGTFTSSVNDVNAAGESRSMRQRASGSMLGAALPEEDDAGIPEHWAGA